MKILPKDAAILDSAITKVWIDNLESIKTRLDNGSISETAIMFKLYEIGTDWDYRQSVYEYLTDDNLKSYFRKLIKKLKLL